MGYEINDNTYTTLKRVEVYDVFTRKKTEVARGTDIDSVHAAGIIVAYGDREAHQSLSQQDSIDLKITQGYIELKA